jgi:hypothetical protein
MNMLIKYKWIVIGIFLFVAIPLILLAFSPSQNRIPQTSDFLTPTVFQLNPTTIASQPISPLQKTIIGKTTEVEIEQIPGIQKRALSATQNEFTLSSEYALRPNVIITEQQTAAFERIVTPEKSNSLGYTKISEIISRFGQPERMIQGSKHYGWYATTYIYGPSGFVVIGNPSTDEVYEIHRFQSMTNEEYISKFGSDIDESLQPEEDFQ